MATTQINRGPLAEPSLVSILPVLDRFFEGVIITDADGVVVYFNPAQARIDDLQAEDAIGKTVTTLYRVDEGFSPTMKCLRSGRAILNLPCYYRTRLGKVVNSIHNVYPLFSGESLTGSICFITDYSIIEQAFDTVGQSRPGRPRTGRTELRRIPFGRRRNNGTRFTFRDIVGRDDELQRSVEIARLASHSPSPIMLCGETGTGKELFAQAIHNNGRRKQARYVAVNCSAIPENLLEGILFGTTPGAFTGATDKAGLFERANGGTLFLDEINSMPLTLQVKMLRALQERRVRRIGSLKEIEIDLKIISSTSVEPHRAIEDGALRPDLFYRIGVVLIRIPPLRERRTDLQRLAEHFLHKHNLALNKCIPSLSPEILAQFHGHAWPGNVRELEHVIEGAMNLVVGDEAIGIEHLTHQIGAGSVSPPASRPPTAGPGQVPVSEVASTGEAPRTARPRRRGLVENQIEAEITAIRQALTRTGGNAAAAARMLGISAQLLFYKMRKHRIDRREFRPEEV